jgi:7-cyano-7-deazaguanine reductase
MADLPLGAPTSYPDSYAPEVLYPIPRSESRDELLQRETLPFGGADWWTAWEFTWLLPSGKPDLAALEIRVPAESPNIIESKSLKLYLNAFAMQRFASESELIRTVETDLAAVAGAPVTVSLFRESAIAELPGENLDVLDVDIDTYTVDAGLLSTVEDPTIVTETWRSGLLRSLCPVTSQPDFGAVMIRYSGPRIYPESLLAYLVSFRTHQDFHEACIERMFVDIEARCRPEELTVYARYQRRGGLDINPFRSNTESEPPMARTWNQ